MGFWYNTDLLAQAGITEMPTTMDDLDADIATLKDAGINPLSVGAGDKWPAAHYWYYTALRSCPEDVLKDAVTSLDFSDPCFVQAGEELEDLLATEPFNAGFLTTKAQEGADLGLGAARHRPGRHGAPGPLGARRHAGADRRRQGLGDKTGWFPFPRSTAGRATRRTRSAVETPGRSRRRRRTRRSTS